jgi:hypothetical protein
MDIGDISIDQTGFNNNLMDDSGFFVPERHN